MKKHLLVWLMLAFCVLLTGCSYADMAENERKAEDIEVKLSEAYSLVAEIYNMDLAGVVSYKGNILACDAANNKLTILRDSGEILNTFGRLGNGMGEFTNPTGLAIVEDKVYVLDAGNHRIQIYDSNLSYIGSTTLNELSPTDEVYYLDISVSDDGTMYLTANSTFRDISRIYIVNPNGKLITSSEPVYGYTCCDGKEAYCLNTFELFEASNTWKASFSNNYLYKICDDGSLETLAELPYKYGPADFVVEGSDLYVLSSAWARLDHFQTDGTYIETIYHFDNGLHPESYLEKTNNGFVITDRYTGSIYILSNEAD